MGENGSAVYGMSLMTALLDCTKRALIAMICVVDLDVLPVEQIIVALIISVTFVIFLRVFRPFRSWWRLGMALLIESIDCMTFVLGICVVSASNKDEALQYRCGLLMICTQGIAYCLMLGEKLAPAFKQAFSFLCHPIQFLQNRTQ